MPQSGRLVSIVWIRAGAQDARSRWSDQPRSRRRHRVRSPKCWQVGTAAWERVCRAPETDMRLAPSQGGWGSGSMVSGIGFTNLVKMVIAEYPPSTINSAPVMKEPASEARRIVAPTSSLASPKRSIGVWRMMLAMRSSVSHFAILLCWEESGDDGIDANSLRSPLAGKIAAQVVHSGLAHRIGEHS